MNITKNIKELEMEKIKSSYKPTATHLYSFKIYQEDGDKFLTDFYTAEDARIMWDTIKFDGDVFSCSKANLNDNYLEDVNSKQDIS
jgi:hypothetical protein